MLEYDEKQDRSEEFGWKKYCDETVPSEQEQDLWGAIAIGSTLVLALLGYFFGG